ncbi:hypothetical protein HOE31_02965 [bacterium]|jgi:hypothetical protein|nr:hypothetical protein [bacterium]MBT4495346.1 hypothetical protein [bacterium]MBT4763735.1 hypothetical protein [bacterium]MBT5401105.1 hypothetical protein [bacterium]MBT5942934.1 hypothetical protein [bacterium]
MNHDKIEDLLKKMMEGKWVITNNWIDCSSQEESHSYTINDTIHFGNFITAQIYFFNKDIGEIIFNYLTGVYSNFCSSLEKKTYQEWHHKTIIFLLNEECIQLSDEWNQKISDHLIEIIPEMFMKNYFWNYGIIGLILKKLNATEAMKKKLEEFEKKDPYYKRCSSIIKAMEIEIPLK